MKAENEEADLDKEFVEVLDKVASANQEGLEKLAKEEVAERRSQESLLRKFVRISRRKLGLRETDAMTVSP